MRKSVGDYPLVILALLLSAYGIAVVYSAGQTDFPVAYVVGAWKRQLAWFGLALGAAYFLYRASVRLVDWLTVPLYWIGIVLLIVTLIFGSGAGTAASVKGWRTGDNPARWRGHLAGELPQPRKVKRVAHRPALPWERMGAFEATPWSCILPTMAGS